VLSSWDRRQVKVMSQGDNTSSNSSTSNSSSSSGNSSNSSSSSSSSNVPVEGKVGARLLYEGGIPREIDVVFSLRNPGGAWLIDSVAIVRDSLTERRRRRSSSSSSD
jgi:hypothetical protein